MKTTSQVKRLITGALVMMLSVFISGCGGSGSGGGLGESQGSSGGSGGGGGGGGGGPIR